MDMSDKDKFELEKRNDNPMNYPPPSMSSDWRFSGANLTNTPTPMGLVHTDNPMAVGSSSPSSASMVHSYSPTIWDHPTNSQDLGFCNINVQNNVSSTNTIENRKGCPASLRSGIDRPLEVDWNPPSSMLKGGIFLPIAPGMLPQSLARFPADSAFIERAARYSSFNDGNFSDMVNSFGIPEPMGLYSRAGGMMQGPQEVFAGNGLKSVSSGPSQKNEQNVGEASNDVSLSIEHGTTEGSPLKNERKSESLVRSYDEAKQGVGGSGNESDEAEFNGGGGGQEEPSVLEYTGGEPSAKGLGSKKSKRNGQVTDLDQAKKAQQPGEAAKDNIDNQQKGDQNPTSTTKTVGKNGKQGPQASEPPKDYLHVRARRGQATDSHSLAERVRREKISERMKLLQDLVPGCNKVTGKAVMLEEIINYVQSLQRQVEFLSMRSAAVNPWPDFNIEGLLGKYSRAGLSSTMGISPYLPMAYAPLHPSQPVIIPAPLPGLGSPFDILQRTVNSQLTTMTGGYKEPTQTNDSHYEIDFVNALASSSENGNADVSLYLFPESENVTYIHRRRDGWSHKVNLKWMFVITNFVLEIALAVFGRLFSMHKLRCALISMLISFIAMLLSIVELIYEGKKERVVWKWLVTIPWFHYPSPSDLRFGTFKDFVGLACSILQFIVAAMTYSFARKNADNPIKISYSSIIFAFGLLCSQVLGRPNRRTPSLKRGD